MKNREILQTSFFDEKVRGFLKDHKLKLEDFDAFKRKLAENPEMGEMIQGTGGVRKTRLKAASKGKRGGFRVCYYFHDVATGKIYLLTIYPKNEKEDITPDEKKDLKRLADIFKGR